MVLRVGSTISHHEARLRARPRHGTWSVQLVVLIFTEVLCAIQVLIVLLVGPTARTACLGPHVLQAGSTTIGHGCIARRFQLLLLSRDHHGSLAARHFFLATSRVGPRCRANLAGVPAHQTYVFHVQGPR